MRHEDFLIHAKALIWDINQTRERIENIEKVYELRYKSINSRMNAIEAWVRIHGGGV